MKPHAERRAPTSIVDDRLFTPRFFLMCGFSFTVFLSAFQLVPTAPFRILDLGGSPSAAGLFLGCLTYASALTAPFTGALADRFGKRRMLILCGLVIAASSLAYGLSTTYWLLLVLVFVHGGFWSGLLSASAAYTAEIVPERRRAEGISYWGLSTLLAIAVAPSIGFWIYRRGWGWLCTVAGALNLLMAAIAWRLPETRTSPREQAKATLRPVLEWRVLAMSVTLFLYSFGYGGLTSFVALYGDANGVTPRGLYFTSFALVTLLTRPFAGRLADRVGYRRVLLPCLVLIVAGLALLAVGGTRPWLVASALVFGTGFGAAYPVFAALILKTVDPLRRGAAFGAMLTAFDTGIGTGSIATGVMVHRWGFAPAFGVAAVLAAFSLPYFLFVEKRFPRSG